MAKLSACMEIVNSMSDADRDDMLTRLDTYIADGVPAEQAQKMAAQDALEELLAEQAEFSRLLREQHPDLFNATIPEDQDVDPDMPDAVIKAMDSIAESYPEIDEFRSAWAGGIADLGNRDAAYDVPFAKGYGEYKAKLVAELSKLADEDGYISV
jgi:hypothetical protein